MNSTDKTAHAQRMLDHLGNQWPISEPATLRTSNERELAAMLRRAVHQLASVALLDVDAEVKQAASAFVREAQRVLRRTDHV